MTTAVVLGVMSRNRVDEAGKAPDQPSGYEKVQDAKDLALSANLAFGIGGAALATAAVLFVLDIVHNDKPTLSPSLALRPSGFAGVISGTF